jgi:xylulokinase
MVQYSHMAYYLGIDVGTSGTKVLVMDAEGAVLATATSPHGISIPRPGWSEQDPREWWGASCKACRAALARAKVPSDQVAGIGLSGQMHGLVMVDGAGEPLRPCILWNDQRTAEQAAQIEARAGGKSELVAMVGNVAVTSFTLSRVLWVRQHEPAIYEKAKHILLPKDYVRLRMTGEYAADVSDASGTLMLDNHRRDWSGWVLSLFDVDRSLLPPVLESHQVAGRLTSEAAEAMGLSPGVPVVAGGGDQPVGAVGCGVVEEGLVSATIGTSGIVLVHSPRYRTDASGGVQTFCASVAGEWCMFGCVMAAGGSLQWFRNVLGGEEVAAARKRKVDPYELLGEQAALAAPGCRGLFWLPYLTGERTPHADPRARACWIGLHAGTTRPELVRSVMEGATFAMNDVLSVFREMGMTVRQMRLSGGGARSELWRRLQADIYGVPCAMLSAQEGPAYGAAILAAVGTGLFKDVRQAARAGIRVTQRIQPNPRRRKLYAERYALYRGLYPILRNTFAQISELQG